MDNKFKTIKLKRKSIYEMNYNYIFGYIIRLQEYRKQETVTGNVHQ